MRSILDACPADQQKQTMMFSATWPEEVQDLASDFLGDFTFMKIGSIDLQVRVPLSLSRPWFIIFLQANKNIEQEVVVTTVDYKMEQFMADMEERMKTRKVLVFAERKSTVDRLERFLRNRRIRSMGIHGDKTQRTRTETIQKFKVSSYFPALSITTLLCLTLARRTVAVT